MQYSNDLRRKLLEAWPHRDGTQPESAPLFGVSRSYLRKVLGPRRRRGDRVVLDNLGAHQVAEASAPGSPARGSSRRRSWAATAG